MGSRIDYPITDYPTEILLFPDGSKTGGEWYTEGAGVYGGEPAYIRKDLYEDVVRKLNAALLAIQAMEQTQ